MFFWNAGDLTRKLGEFRDYYNADRVHRALAGATPAQRAGAPSPPGADGGVIVNSPPTGPRVPVSLFRDLG